MKFISELGKVFERVNFILYLLIAYAAFALALHYFLPFGVGTHDFLRPIKFLPNFIVFGLESRDYLSLALGSYQSSHEPLYPFLLSFFSKVFFLKKYGLLGAAQLINFLSQIVSFYYLKKYLEAHKIYRNDIYALASMLVVFFPIENVYFSIYPESLFLAFFLAALTSFKNGKTLIASILLGLSSLITSAGCIFVVALILNTLLESLLQRKFNLKDILISLIGLLIVIGWNIILYFLGDNKSVASTSHVSPNHTFRILLSSFSNFKILASHTIILIQFLFCLLGLGAAVYNLYKKRYLEFFIIVIFFIVSLFFDISSSFWLRFYSTLFMVHIMVSRGLEKFPRLQIILVVISFAFFIKTLI